MQKQTSNDLEGKEHQTDVRCDGLARRCRLTECFVRAFPMMAGYRLLLALLVACMPLWLHGAPTISSVEVLGTFEYVSGSPNVSNATYEAPQSLGSRAVPYATTGRTRAWLFGGMKTGPLRS